MWLRGIPYCVRVGSRPMFINRVESHMNVLVGFYYRKDYPMFQQRRQTVIGQYRSGVFKNIERMSSRRDKIVKIPENFWLGGMCMPVMMYVDWLVMGLGPEFWNDWVGTLTGVLLGNATLMQGYLMSLGVSKKVYDQVLLSNFKMLHDLRFYENASVHFNTEYVKNDNNGNNN